LTIGIIGALAPHKGLKIVQQMLVELRRNKQPCRIVHFGTSTEELASPHFISAGVYQPELLPRLSYQYDIDVFLIPSICPETYSLTLLEIMDMQMPVAVFDLGAQGERASKYQQGLVLKSFQASQVLAEMLSHFRSSIAATVLVEHPKVLFVHDQRSSAGSYRVDNLREQLWRQGIDSDLVYLDERQAERTDDEFWELAIDAQSINWSEYASVYLAAITNSKAANKLIKKCQQAGIFLAYGVEAADPAPELIQQSSAIIVRTEQLAETFRQSHVDKPVLVWPDRANFALVALSSQALQAAKQADDAVRIGCLWDSAVSNQDRQGFLQIIETSLNSQPNVRIGLIGQAEDQLIAEFALKAEFELKAGFEDRLEYYPMPDVASLPALLKSLDFFVLPGAMEQIQAGVLDLICMASALVEVPVITQAGASIEQGLVARRAASATEWLEILETLVGDPSLRQELGAAARHYVTENLLTDKIDRQVIDFVLAQSNSWNPPL
jgi:hypothetical protein